MAAGLVVGVAVEDLLEGYLAVQLRIQRHEDGAQTAAGVGPQDTEPLSVGSGRADAVRGSAVGVGFGLDRGGGRWGGEVAEDLPRPRARRRRPESGGWRGRSGRRPVSSRRRRRASSGATRPWPRRRRAGRGRGRRGWRGARPGAGLCRGSMPGRRRRAGPGRSSRPAARAGRRAGRGRRRWRPWGGPPGIPTRTRGVRPPKPGACGRGAPDQLDYLMPDRTMQPRRGLPALPRVRQSRGPAWGRMCLFAQEAHASIGAPDPSAVARARCQGKGPLPLDVRRPAHDSSCLGVKDGLQRTVRLNRCRRRGLSSEPTVALRASVRRHEWR